MLTYWETETSDDKPCYGSRVVNILEDIKICNNNLQQISSLKEKLEKELNEKFLAPFSKFKEFIIDKIWENFDEEYKDKVLNEREFSQNSTAFSMSTIFDPKYDSFGLLHWRFDENKNVIFTVECHKLREYLGITGSWIPATFDTVPIDFEELRKIEFGE